MLVFAVTLGPYLTAALVVMVIGGLYTILIKLPRDNEAKEKMKSLGSHNYAILYVDKNIKVQKIEDLEGVPYDKENPARIPDHDVVLVPLGRQRLTVSYYKVNLIGSSVSGARVDKLHDFEAGKSYRLSYTFPSYNSISYHITEYYPAGPAMVLQPGEIFLN